MIRQFSAGGIVFKGDKVLVVKNASIKDKKTAYWGFPKGHLEKGEGSKEAALREVKEETGIEAKISSKLGEVSYIFTQYGERIFKVVTFFLMEYVSGEDKAQLNEVSQINWLSPKDALEILSFKNDKEMLQKALDIKNG
jgi:8-oxo-dGTP diphosphatase